MVAAVVKSFFYRIVLPAGLIIAALLRPSLISLIFGLLALLNPHLPGFSGRNTASSATRAYLYGTAIFATLAFAAQIVYQVISGITETTELYEETCNNTDKSILRQVGFFRLYLNEVFVRSSRALLPEVVALLCAWPAVVLCTSEPNDAPHAAAAAELDGVETNFGGPVTQQASAQRSRATTRDSAAGDAAVASKPSVLRGLIGRLSDIVALLCMWHAGTLLPSVLSFTYLAAFLLLLTWWGACQPLRRGCFNTIKLVVAVFCAIHLTILYLYQLEGAKAALPPDHLLARILGLTEIVRLQCPETYRMIFSVGLRWPVYTSPAFLLFFYYYIVYQYRFTRYGVRRRQSPAENWPDDASSVHEELPLTKRRRTSGDKQSKSVAIESPSDNELLAAEQDQEEDVFNAPADATQASNPQLVFQRLLSVAPGNLSGPVAARVLPVIAFAYHHCYAVTLGAMMLWAIFYHSWLGFVWLVVACGIWIVPNSRRWCFFLSPLIVLYAIILIVQQYVYSLNLTEAELPDEEPVILRQIGLIKPENDAFFDLWVKICLSLPFFLTLRLHIKERYFGDTLMSRDPARDYGTFAPGEVSVSRTVSAIGGTSWIGDVFAKYWIFVAAFVLLLAGIGGTVYMYTIGYMLFFCFLVIAMQLNWRCFRTLLFVYWTTLVIYSSAVLVAIYLYQFYGIPEWWQNATGIDAQFNKDIGLTTYPPGELLLKLLQPISILIVMILQLKFFHRPWLRLTSLVEAREAGYAQLEAAATRQGTATHKLTTFEELVQLYEWATEILWRLAEIHARKVVLFVLILVCANELCALNWPVVLLVAICLLIPKMAYLIYLLAAIYITFIVGARMVFQLEFVRNETLQVAVPEGCGSVRNLTANESVSPAALHNASDSAAWLGLEKAASIFSYLFGDILALIFIAAQVVVAARQKYKEEEWKGAQADGMPPVRERGVVFHDVARPDADRDFINCLKYFVNYTFYKFGVELSFLCAVIVIMIRMDAVAFIYAILLLLLVAIYIGSRSMLSRVWLIYLVVLFVLLPLQYALAVGFPPAACISYPWEFWSGESWGKNLIMWLNLPDYVHPPNATLLVGDFLQLLLVSLQLIVFRVEHSAAANNYPGGSNASILAGNNLKGSNPVGNFIDNKSTSLDLIKHVLFMYSPWVTLAIVLIAGLGSTTLFAMGYLIAAFILLWRGNDLYLQPMRRITSRWRLLVIYNVIIIAIKVLLQLVGCVFIDTLKTNVCFVVKLFSIICLNPRALPVGDPESCPVRRQEADIGYDALCFCFLILQFRILRSWYFQHVIFEYRAERVLSSRGAVLIKQLVSKEIKEQKDAEEAKFKQIQTRTEIIREMNERENLESGRVVREPRTYGEAKRAGDYYMFEHDPRESQPLPLPGSWVPEPTPGAGTEKSLGPGQLLHTVLDRDLDARATLEAAKRAEQLPKDDQAIAAITTETESDSSELPTRDPDFAIIEPDFAEDPPAYTEADKPDTSVGDKALSWLEFAWKLVESVLDKCSAFFNRRSRSHRYVAHVLAEEKRRLKDTQQKELEAPSKSLRQIRRDVAFGELGEEIHCVKCEDDIARLEDEAIVSWRSKNVVTRFFIALGYLLISNTELLCYLLMIANMTFTAAIIALPFPLLAFFWGTLCSPRPPKLFWIVTIAYTEIVIIIKFIFQFGLFNWHPEADPSPYYPPRIIGIERQSRYAAFDVALLISLFFHRYMLRTLGLWKNPLEIAKSDKVQDDSQAVLPSSTAEDNDQKRKKSSHSSSRSSSLSKPSVHDDAATDITTVEPSGHYSCLTYFGVFGRFFYRVLHPAERLSRDLYVFMFLCDVLALILIIFNYTSFGASGSGSIISDIQQNTISISFVLYLLGLSFLMVLDRGIYLRKSEFWKLVLQLVLTCVVHAWIFFLLPAATKQSTTTNGAVQFWYFVKGIYFLFSASQIRNGYPTYSLGNLLTRSYNLICFALFKGFMLAPFLWELRTSIDWTWTDTSMSLFDYFNMENFYTVAFELKCMRKLEKDFPAERGVAKGKVVKHLMGVPLVIFLVMIIFIPLVIFALLNQIGETLPPKHVQFSISIQGYPELYKMEAQGEDLQRLNDSSLNLLHRGFSISKDVQFLDRYEHGGGMSQRDLLRPQSNGIWAISPPAEAALLRDLNHSTSDMFIGFSWQFTRPRANGSTEKPLVHSGENIIVLDPIVGPVKGRVRPELVAALISKDERSPPVTIYNAFPPYVVIPNEGPVRDAPLLNTMASKAKLPGPTFAYTAINLTLVRDKASGNRYWEVVMWLREDNAADMLVLPPPVKNNMTDLQMVAFVDRVFPSIISSFVSGGIIAMYIILVVTLAAVVRGMFLKAPMDVQINEIPDPDPLMNICQDVYLVREAKDFRLEQDLFARLIFLFRSPETLIKWTKMKYD